MDGKARLVKVVPTLSLTAYSVGDQMGGVLTLTNALDESSDTGTVLSVQVVDKAKQKPSFDILFFNSLPSVVSVDNAALDVTDAEMDDKYIGRVSVLSTDFKDILASSDATVLGVGLLVQGLRQPHAPATKNLYALIQCQGTPTYGTTTDLTLRIGILQD